MNRDALAQLFHDALAELALAPLVAAALPARGPAAHVIAIGKAAPAMARGALTRLGARVATCLVVAPDGTEAHDLERVVMMRASHPVPDARSVRAGRACLAAAAAAQGELVVLVSGGASALVCVPSGVTLRTKRAITSQLLRSGSSIQELNVVRKHLSLVKGGGLLRAARGAKVTTLIASDVIGGTAADVGSGPSVPDPSSAAEARRILRRHAPAFADVPLGRRQQTAAAVDAKILASPELLARAVATRLRGTLLPSSQGEVAALAAEYLALAAGRPGIYVRAAEPAVRVIGRAGRGGRSTHLASLVARELAVVERAGRVTFAAFASDGVDGRSGTAGAIIDASTRVDDAAIARFDTGTLLRTCGAALPESPSGHNLADIHVLVVGGAK